MTRWFVVCCCFLALGRGPAPARASGSETTRAIGVARIDITPSYPIRLAGYAARKTEATEVAQRLWAKALAIGADSEKPALLITVDNCGVPFHVRQEVVARLQRRQHLEPERVAICSTHTHSAPWLVGYLPNLFGGPVPAEQQAHCERYTRELTDALEQVAWQALASRQAARLSWGRGTAAFAANRRTKGGPVDHDLPVLAVTGLDGQVRAIFASYASHCTTLTGESNQISGDWAGYAQEALEQQYPGAVALVALGCAGDANPNPRPGTVLAKQHGESFAAGVGQVLNRALPPVNGKLACRLRRVDLPFEPLPSRAEWEARTRSTNSYIRAQARLNLARLDRGESIPKQLEYWVQTWSFDQELAMVFLAGEVVVDYSLRLKHEFDSSRLWVNAYANDVPCYIASERILREGGYEGGGAMVYYDRPARLAPGVEDRIVGTVHKLLPRQFRAPRRQAIVPGALFAAGSLPLATSETMQTPWNPSCAPGVSSGAKANARPAALASASSRSSSTP